MQDPEPMTLGDLAARANARFGTSGVRGRVADLTPQLCAAYTRAFLSLAPDQARRMLIGYDLRPSSPGIARACHAAAQAAGFETVNAGILPSPALALAAGRLQIPAIMVTGSHIPADRNGLKFYLGSSEITKVDEQRILAFPLPAADNPSTEDLPVIDPFAPTLYAARYRNVFGSRPLGGLRIGVYEHSSAARDMLPGLLQALGAETESLGRSGSFIAIDTEAVAAEDAALARSWASRHRLDAVVSTDGDADRPLLADEAGEWLRGDVLGLLAARALGAATVVTPLNSSTAIEASGAFQEVIRTAIGSPHVIAGMARARHRPVVGFEANGGFLLGTDVALQGGMLTALPTRDAVLPLILVISAARGRNQALSRLVQDLPQRRGFSNRLRSIEPAECRALLADETKSLPLLRGSDGPILHIDRTDGLRVTYADGDIVHVRPSGNAPELRCYTEAATAARAEDLCRSCLARFALVLTGTSG